NAERTGINILPNVLTASSPEVDLMVPLCELECHPISVVGQKKEKSSCDFAFHNVDHFIGRSITGGIDASACPDIWIITLFNGIKSSARLCTGR
ncbi:MAG: hypothetical protein ABIV36_02690, partial [Sphingobium limneticum]